MTGDIELSVVCAKSIVGTEMELYAYFAPYQFASVISSVQGLFFKGWGFALTFTSTSQMAVFQAGHNILSAGLIVRLAEWIDMSRCKEKGLLPLLFDASPAACAFVHTRFSSTNAFYR